MDAHSRVPIMYRCCSLFENIRTSADDDCRTRLTFTLFLPSPRRKRTEQRKLTTKRKTGLNQVVNVGTLLFGRLLFVPVISILHHVFRRCFSPLRSMCSLQPSCSELYVMLITARGAPSRTVRTWIGKQT